MTFALTFEFVLGFGVGIVTAIVWQAVSASRPRPLDVLSGTTRPRGRRPR